MVSKAVEAALKNYNLSNNQLMVAGQTVSDLVRQYGTPCYIYDSSIIKKKIDIFRRAMPDQIKLSYAVKANPHPDLLKEMVHWVDGFDVASEGELNAVINAGGAPETISFAGPGKRRAELSQAIQTGIGSINIESEREMELIVEESKILDKIPNVSFRINPDFELTGSGMKMGGGAKQFGIDSEIVPDLIKKIKALPINFQGYHLFAGSQNLKADALCSVMEQSLELIYRLAGASAGDVKLINLGGGLGIPYFDKDTELDILKIGKHLKVLLEKFTPCFPGAEFKIELGRYLVGECGIYITKVLYKKDSRGKTFLVTDGGMNHHLAASGNFGQVLRKNYPIILGNRVHSQKTEPINIVGPLCTPLDSLGVNMTLPVANENDLIIILNSGAYGYSASPHLFLGHPLPKEVFL